MRLSREQILGLDDLEHEDVEVPEWGEGVVQRVRALTAEERDAFEVSLIPPEPKTNGKGRPVAPDPKARDKALANMRARLVVMGAINEDGSRTFTEADAAKLGRKSAGPIDRLATAIRRLSKLDDEDVEELVKNSEPSPEDSSSSD